jgi:hypothetical protein
MNILKVLVPGLVAMLSGPAMAGSLLTVDVTDDIYGDQSVTLWPNGMQSVTWMSAGFFWSGNIGLTDDAGIILYDIETNHDDVYTLFAPPSGYSSIGTPCLASDTFACVVLSGPTSLYSAINAMNGGSGICCGGSDLVVTPGPGVDVVPEPASWAMMVGGFGLIGGMMRGRRKTAVNFA